jgi:hypothetical protein
LFLTAPLWANWQSRLSQKEKHSQFESGQGYQLNRFNNHL